MGKLIFRINILLLLISILFIGCAPEYTLIVDNQSSQNVTFTMVIGYSEYTKTLTTESQYIHPNPIPAALKGREQMKKYEPPDIDLIHEGDVYTFKDSPIEIIPEP